MSKTALITQARMGSKRLPGKILKPILGRPVLDFFVERAKRISNIDSFIIATSTDPEDQPIVEFCQSREIPYFRGSLDDVLSRYYECAKHFKVDHIVRITSDCPLMDPGLSEEVIRFYLNEKKWDYISNNRQPVYPHGVDTEIFSFFALEKAHKNASSEEDREHVSSYMTEEKNGLVFGQAPHSISQNYQKHRWTLDYPEDFKFIERVLEELYPKNPNFSWKDIIDLVEKKSEIFAINQMHSKHG